MARHTLLKVTAIVTAALFGPVPAASSADESANAQRLRDMPIEQRTRLVEKLREYDTLSAPEKAVVTTLDEALAAKPEAERDNYYAVLRRYHLWLRSLPEARRAEIERADAKDRLALVEKIVKQQRAEDALNPPFFQTTDALPVSPYDLASRVKFWLSLTPAQRDEVDRVQDPTLRQRKLADLARELKFKSIPRHVSPAADEQALERFTKRRTFPALKKAEDFTKDAIKKRIADHDYFVEHPPARVNAETLQAFTLALPSWLRSTFDPLPPDEARRRLTVIYRLVFPQGSEYRPQKFAATAPAGTPSANTPGGSPSVPPTPPGRPGTPGAGKAPSPPKPPDSSSPF